MILIVRRFFDTISLAISTIYPISYKDKQTQYSSPYLDVIMDLLNGVQTLYLMCL